MRFLVLRLPPVISSVIIIVSSLVSGFLLLFGVANLIHPDVPETYLTQNTIICLVITCVGLAFLFLVIAVIRGLLQNK